MFDVYCPAHDARVLLTTGHIEALHNTPDGIVIDWHCWCGEHGSTWAKTGETCGPSPLQRAC